MHARKQALWAGAQLHMRSRQFGCGWARLLQGAAAAGLAAPLCFTHINVWRDGAHADDEENSLT